MTNEDLIHFRSMLETDKAFIHYSWLNGLYKENSWFKKIDKKAYYESYPAVISSILENPGTEGKIACLKEDPDVILGYSIFDREGERLHYVFVKLIWQKLGLMKKLLPENMKITTHLTDLGLKILEKNYSTVKFNPFLN